MGCECARVPRLLRRKGGEEKGKVEYANPSRNFGKGRGKMRDEGRRISYNVLLTPGVRICHEGRASFWGWGGGGVAEGRGFVK